MIKLFDSSKKNYRKKLLTFLEKRRHGKEIDTQIVSKILKDIKKNKTKALLKYEKKFSNNSSIVSSKKEIDQAIRRLDPKVRKAIDFVYNKILNFHKKQLVNLKNIYYRDKFNNKLEYRTVPISRIGIYTPSGLPTSLLMTAIVARLANVKSIFLATPKTNGELNSAIMYVAKKTGIKSILNCGGAQAIAALAYIKKVHKIVGPSNVWGSEAKRQLSGKIIGTEAMYAGESEICVIADKKTDINQIVSSLISQAEHSLGSQSILITKDREVIIKVKKEIPKVLKNLPRKKIAAKSLKNNCIIIKAKSDKDIVDSVNLIAPEHLEINVKNYSKYFNFIVNAGSIMCGENSAMVFTDFGTCGINHSLPTHGSARFSSGLNINEFIKKISVVTLSKLGVEKIANQAITLAEYEELKGHALSIKSRIRSK
tara:strand:- start:212 stop:1489 length:1278 start_codon:yes stop_codon:yes gene_type:complete